MIKLRLFFLTLSLFSINGENLKNIRLIVNKIDFHLKFIEKIYKEYQKISIHKYSYANEILEDSFIFQDNLILFCIDEMKKNNEIIHLLNAWEDYNIYKTDDNVKFIKDITLLILIIYKNFLIRILPEFAKNIPIEEILNLYQKSLSLPVNEVIESIDKLYSKINKIINNDSNNFDFQSIFKKNWYVPITITLAIATLIYINKK